MQRVSSFLPSWEKRHSGSRKSGSLFSWSNRTSQPPNGLVKINTAAANGEPQRVHREAFWPATLDLECDKAARILKTFCVDGYLAPISSESPPSPSTTDPKTPVKTPQRIPKRIIQNAAGIAVFTCMRSGLWMTGSGGSGILIARKSDGTWSPPSGIMLHTPTLSFIIGVDVYDCVMVISNLAALETMTRARVTLGEDVQLRPGESVPLDSDEAEVNWRDLGNCVQTYMKARGQHQSVNLGGCILTERSNENERFYSGDVTQMDILAGNVTRHVEETTPLFEVIKMAEGRTDFDQKVINRVAAEPAPGDAIISTPKTPLSPRSAFGLPKTDDPDPFGILALEMAGLEIREAGSRLRPTSSLYDLNQTPLSPRLSKLSRQSVDNKSSRGSYMSTRTNKSLATDIGTHTDSGNTPGTSPSLGLSDGNGRLSPSQIPSLREVDEIDYTVVDSTPIRHLSLTHTGDAGVATSPVESTNHNNNISICDEENTLENPLKNQEVHKDDIDQEKGRGESASLGEDAENNDDDDDDDDEEFHDADDEDDIDDDEDEPVVFEVAAVQPARTQVLASRVIQARGNVVTIAKRVPPPLPLRSPARVSRINKAGIEELKSPLRQVSNEEDMVLSNDDHTSPKNEAVAVGSSGHSERRSTQESTEATLKGERNENEQSDAEGSKHELTKKTGARDSLKQHDIFLNEPHHEIAENSDAASHKKHTSSIYTGVTEDRWSIDGSSVTTPTSERRFSMPEDATAEDTPKKSAKDLEKPESHETFPPLSTVMQNLVTATH